MKKYLLPILLGAGLFISTAFAAPIVQYYAGGTGTSTLPAPGQVLVGFGTPGSVTNTYGPTYLTAGANITITTSSGGITITGAAGGGGSSTSSPSTFTVNGKATSTIASDGTTNSYLPISNTVYNIPTNFATGGCFGSSTLVDFGGCVNYAYSLTTASSVSIMVPSITVTQAQWKTPIVFATNLVIPNLICPGGAKLMYGGTSTAITFNFNVAGTHDVSQDWGCTYLGASSIITAGQTNAATTTGILIGGITGSNAGNGVHFHDNIINGFGSCMDVATNTYMLAITNNAFSGCGSSANQPYPGTLLTFNKASNSGEREIVTGNSFTDPANSTSVNAVYLSDNGNNSTFFSNNSFDDAQIYVGISQAMVNIDSNHFENSSPANYVGYYFIVASSSGATTLNVQNNLFANDAVTGAGNSLGIEEAVNFSFNHNEVNKYGNQTITNFINHDINPGQAIEEACNNWSQNSAVSNWMQLTGLTYPGCFYENNNSFPIIWTTTGANVATLTNGQQTVLSADNNGNVAIPVSGGSLKVQGNVNATGTLNVAGKSTFLGDTTIASTSDNGLFSVINASGTNAFSVATSTANNFKFQVVTGTQQLFGVASSGLSIFSNVNSSTVRIGVNQANPGCIELFDAGNGAQDYVYASATALVITATRPAFCQL